MLIHAYKKADEIIDAIKKLSTEDLTYLDLINHITELEPEDFLDSYETKYAVVDSDDKLIGYIEYEVSGCNWKICSFDRGNIIFVVDCYKLFIKVLKEKESITFYAHKDNPANKLYKEIAIRRLGGYIECDNESNNYLYIIKSKRLFALEDMIDDIAKQHGIKMRCISYYKDYNDFVFHAKFHCDSYNYHRISAKFIDKLWYYCEHTLTVSDYSTSSLGFIEFRFRIRENRFYDSDYYTKLEHRCGISLERRGFTILYLGSCVDYDVCSDGTYERSKPGTHRPTVLKKYDKDLAIHDFNRRYDNDCIDCNACHHTLTESIGSFSSESALYIKTIRDKYTFDSALIKKEKRCD